MSGDADYPAVLADLKKRRDEIDAAIKAVESIIATLGITSSPLKVTGAQDIPRDAFLTLTIAEAAVKYLGLVRSAQSAAQIWEALKTGGLPHTKYAAVYNALVRRQSQAGDIVKLPDGNWGLNEWYPRTPSVLRKSVRRDKQGSALEAVSNNGTTPNLPLEDSKQHLSMVDACERILSEAAKPLHGDELVKRLRAYGRQTSSKSVAGSLPQDSKKRFKNLGRNTWALVRWSDNEGEREAPLR